MEDIAVFNRSLLFFILMKQWSLEEAVGECVEGSFIYCSKDKLQRGVIFIVIRHYEVLKDAFEDKGIKVLDGNGINLEKVNGTI